jgi:predicted nucleotidyltransferase
MSVRFQLEPDADELVFTRMPPELSDATQKSVDAHESDAIHAPESVATLLHEVALPVGLVELKI